MIRFVAEGTKFVSKMKVGECGVAEVHRERQPEVLEMSFQSTLHMQSLNHGVTSLSSVHSPQPTKSGLHVHCPHFFCFICLFIYIFCFG